MSWSMSILDVTRAHVIWLVHMLHDSFICDITHSYVTSLIHLWYDLFIFEMTHSYWHNSFICDMPHAYVTCLTHIFHDSFINDMTWLIHMCDMCHMMCDMTHSYAWHDLFICVTCLNYMWDTTHSYMHVTHMSAGFMSHIHKRHVTHPNTGWRRLIGCLQLQVIFRKRATNYRNLLRKWPMKIRHLMTLRHPVRCIHMCDMPYSYVWHGSFIYLTYLIHTCDMTHSYLWHDWDVYVTRLIHMCDTTHHMRDMPHSYVGHDSFICLTYDVRHTLLVCVTFLEYLIGMRDISRGMSRILRRYALHMVVWGGYD